MPPQPSDADLNLQKVGRDADIRFNQDFLQKEGAKVVAANDG